MGQSGVCLWQTAHATFSFVLPGYRSPVCVANYADISHPNTSAPLLVCRHSCTKCEHELTRNISRNMLTSKTMNFEKAAFVYQTSNFNVSPSPLWPR